MRKRWLVLAALAVLLVAVVILVIPRAQRKDGKIEIATQLITAIYTAPDAKLKKALELPQPDHWEEAVREFADDWVDAETLSSMSGGFINHAIGLQMHSVFRDVTITPGEITVTLIEGQENHYFYEVSASLSRAGGEAKQVVFTGSIQFADSGKVNFMTVEGEGMKELAQMERGQ